METSATSSLVATQSQQTGSASDAWGDVNLNDFIKMLIAELQHQDPLDPMDNAQILQQISQIREISSNDKLIDTLASVRLAQNMATAGSMIGQTVMGLNTDNEWVTGPVDRVSIEDGVAKLHLGEYTVELNNVSQILGESDNEG